MRRLNARIVSYVMIAALGISLWSPVGATQVLAEGNTVEADDNVENPDTKESYKIVLQDSTGKEVTAFSTSDDGELDLASFTMKVVKTEGDSTVEVPTEGRKFTYISSNPEIATVSDEGKITVVDGSKDDSTIDITIQWTGVTSEAGQEAPKAEIKVPVTITKLSAKSIEIVEKEEATGEEKPLENKTLIVQDTFDLSQFVKVVPAGAAKTLVYTSSNPDIVEVSDDGVLTAKGIDKENRTATAVITVSANNNADSEDAVKDTLTVTVIDVPVGLELNQTAHSMKATDTFQLSAELVYASGDKEQIGANKLSFIISDADKNIISVDENGLVTGKVQTNYPVKATVIVFYQPEYDVDGKKPDPIMKSCEITITKIPIEKIVIENKVDNLTLKINETYTLKTAVIPENATDNTISYKTSDKDVAKVSSSGVITATGIGTATITAYTKDDSSVLDTFVVKVFQTEFNIVELGVNGTDKSNDAGDINKILKYATLIDGPITVYIPDGTYYISNTLKVYTETNIILSPNAVIKRMQSAGDKAMLMNRTDPNGVQTGYTQCSDITITGGTWDGNSTGEYDADCLYFGHAQNITITNTTIKNNSGAHLLELAGVQNVLIENVQLYGYTMCKAAGYTAPQADKEAIQIDYCSSVSAPAMKPYDGTACNNVTVRNCNIYNYMAGIGTHTEGSYPSTDILIENNTFNNITNACVNLRNFTNTTIRNNTAKDCTTFVYASGSQGVITNNNAANGTSYTPMTTSGLRAQNGITVSNGSNFTITNNTFEKAKSNGICIWNGSTAVIQNNKIKNNKLYGIRTQGSTVTLKKNSISKNKKGYYDTYKDAKVKSSDDIRAYYINIKKSYKYKGKAVRPKITIKGLNKKYYKVTYKNYKRPGTATVTIKGKGKVKRTLKIKYKITR